MLKIAKVQIIRYVASSLKVLWYGSMDWNMEENFSIECRKIASMKHGKIIFHSYHVLIFARWCRAFSILVKGGESSSQFRWFTIAKIEL